MRFGCPSNWISSTSTKADVTGGSVGGRELQTRGVIFKAPKACVSPTLMSSV
jgi:hypothetical protein